MSRIGYISFRPGPNEFEQAFLRGLRERGWGEAQNLFVDFRWAAFDRQRVPVMVAELLALHPALIVVADGSGLAMIRSLNPAMSSSYVNQLVNQVSNHPALFGYFLRDEPPPSDFPGLGNWRASFKADPDKLFYMSLGWDYDYTDYIAQTGQDDFLSYDFYGVLEDGRIHSYYFPCLEKARGASLSSGLPFWNTVSSIDGYSDNPDWNTAPPSPENLRFQLYTSLAYGAQGISYYVYCHPGHTGAIANADGTPTALYDPLKRINREFAAIAAQVKTLRSCGVYHSGHLPRGTEALPAKSPWRLDPGFYNSRPTWIVLVAMIVQTSRRT